MAADTELGELRSVVTSGEAMLFTGAGFSSDARDLDGKALPDSNQMIAELWSLVFGDGVPDDSSLQDLYDAALQRVRPGLASYVARRLRVGDAPLPTHYARWFAAPWRKIYTLNVDDVEVAVQRQFRLPHRLRSVSALTDRKASFPGVIDVVHLNGLACDEPGELTFSTLQYATRLCGREREYERLAEDLASRTFVFAGTTLDESLLWQHLELRQRRAGAGPRPVSFLVSSALSRARQVLLESLQIRWIRATTAEFADLIL